MDTSKSFVIYHDIILPFDIGIMPSNLWKNQSKLLSRKVFVLRNMIDVLTTHRVVGLSKY